MISPITRSISAELLLPKDGKGPSPLWKSVSVPEITVNKYGDLGTVKHDIWRARQSSHVLPEAESTPVKSRANHNLYGCVFPANS
jgi:hypothetical protein